MLNQTVDPQIFWMAQVTLFKYLVISNNHFTMNSFTDKDALLVIFVQIFWFICDKNFNLVRPAIQFFPKNRIFGVKIIIFLIPGQNFGIIASATQGMDIFLLEMSMK